MQLSIGFQFPGYVLVCSLGLKQEVSCLFNFLSEIACERCLTDLDHIVTLSTIFIKTAVCIIEKTNYLEIPRGSLCFTWNALFVQIPEGSHSFHKYSPCPEHMPPTAIGDVVSHASLYHPRCSTHLVGSLCYDCTLSHVPSSCPLLV